MALVTVLQFKENLTDRQAADAVRSRIDWKYLLGLELIDEGFHFSVLSESRKRLIENKQEQQQIEMVDPMRKNASWQSKLEGGYDETKFNIDWDAKVVTCPEGKQSIAWKEYTKSRQRVRALFYKWDCLPCSARKLCTQDVRRSLSFLPKAQYKALEKTRQVHRSQRGQERYKRRAGIEGALSQGVRGFGLRRSRYRGLAKTHL